MSDEARISMKAVVLMATALPALSHWELKVGGTRGSEAVRGTELARRSPPFLSRERTAVSDSVRVDVDPEPSRPRYRETCLALESAEESGAAVSGVNRGVFGSLARHPRSRSSVSSRGGHAEI